MATYVCRYVDEPGTRTSSALQPMFDAWAGTLNVRLCPGTAYLCAETTVVLPEDHISLARFEHLHSAAHQRLRPGYAPRVYPVALADCQIAWVYRWSEDDPGLGFLGDHGGCDAGGLLEVVAPVHIRDAFGTSRLSLRFVADVGG